MVKREIEHNNLIFRGPSKIKNITSDDFRVKRKPYRIMILTRESKNKSYFQLK